MHRLRLSYFLVVISLFIFLGAGTALAVEQLSMGTSSVGGLFPNLGFPIAQCMNQALPDVNITAEFTEGSTENLRLIKQKKMHLGIISPMVGYFARHGTAMFKDKPVDFRVIARLIPNGNVWTTLKSNKDIHTIYDFKGHRVGIGTGGIGVVSRLQLEFHGIDVKKDIKPFFPSTGELATLLKDGKIDVSFLTEGLAKQVTATHEIKMIPWQEKDIDKYVGEKPYFGEFLYPANHFKGVDYEVLTVDNGIQFIADADLNDDLVYNLVKAFNENLGCVAKTFAPAKALSLEWSAKKLGNPYHPGAIRYYKEKGVWKD